MQAQTIKISLTGDKETFQELLRVIAHAAETSESVAAEEALWDLHDRIATEAEADDETEYQEWGDSPADR